MLNAAVNGININYQESGQGEPFTLIIGLGSDKSNWRLQTTFFGKHYRIITFDNRGSGRSDKPAEPYTIKAMADDTIGLLDHIGIERTHLLGISMGGMIAQELAIRYPERVEKLVLASTFARREGESGFSEEVSRAVKTWEASPQGITDTRRVIDLILDLTFNKLSYRVLALPLMRTAVRFSSLRGVGEQLRATLGHDVYSRLPIIQAPTLVITGTADRVIKPSSSEVIAKSIPGSTLVKIEGGSHGLSGEMSGEFNTYVMSFLKK